MNINEGQPSGPNPEWEQNREQNIAIAKKVDRLLISSPDTILDIVKIMEEKGISDEEAVRIVKSYQEMFPELPLDSIESVGDAGLIIAQREMTIGYTKFVKHINNPNRTIVVGVAYSDEASRDEQSKGEVAEPIELLPDGFNYPVYIFKAYTNNIYDESTEFNVSTIYGELPNRIIGADGLVHDVYNVYCFNFLGQGLKIEEISRGAPLEAFLYNEEQMQLAEQKLKGVGFVPSEEHSRVMPLTPEDYTKINKMFEQIDAGLYKFRA